MPAIERTRSASAPKPADPARAMMLQAIAAPVPDAYIGTTGVNYLTSTGNTTSYSGASLSNMSQTMGR